MPDVAAALELAVLVEHERDAAAHAGGEVAAGRAEHDDDAARHVLAAVIADAFDDRGRAAVAHGEALAGDAGEERLARTSRRRATVLPTRIVLVRNEASRLRAGRTTRRPPESPLPT